MQLSLSRKQKLFGLSFVFVALSLACAQAGDILTEAEATRRARPTATIEVDLTDVAIFAVDELVQIFADHLGALVPLYKVPGERFFASQISNRELVLIQNQGIDADGGIWYYIDGQAGEGWITEELLRVPEIDLSVE